MGKSSRPYPTGHFRLYKTSRCKSGQRLVVQIEYAVKSQAIRRSTGISTLEKDWNPNENKGRGGVRSSYGTDYKIINNRLLKRVSDLDTQIANWCEKNPNQLTLDIIKAFLDGLPIIREDKGIDFADFVREMLANERSRNKIGQSVYKNGISGMNIFGQFLQAENLGTYARDKIYVSEISTNLIERYIKWRRELKHNSDETINHSLTPILKACKKAADLGYIPLTLNGAIQGMRIIKTTSLQSDISTKVKHLTTGQLTQLIEFYKIDKESRRKEYIEMFLFAMHACGLRLVDILTLQWSEINFDKKTLNKIQVKTRNRNIIPLTESASEILNRWKGRNLRFVFGLLPDDFNLDDAKELYRMRNTKTRGINQALTVVGEKIKLPFDLTFHVARHTFAVQSLNNGISMTMVSQLLGHSSSEITEKVYAHFIPAKMMDALLQMDLPRLSD